MTTVELRIDVPEEMTPAEIVKLLDGIQNHVEGHGLGLLDDAPRTSDASWMDEDTGDVHYWNP